MNERPTYDDDPHHRTLTPQEIERELRWLHESFEVEMNQHFQDIETKNNDDK